MQLTRVVAIRHGETAWNVDTRIQGQLDVPLNERGRRQAARLGPALADEGLAAIYCSDLSRAADTARALAEAIGLHPQCDRRLRERGFGEFEGLSFAEIERRWPEQALRWRRRDPGFGPAGGETLQDFARRAVDACDALAAAHPGQAVALVAHGGVLDALYRAATGAALDAPRQWRLDNATINRVLHHGEGFSLVGWNDDHHLDGV